VLILRSRSEDEVLDQPRIEDVPGQPVALDPDPIEYNVLRGSRLHEPTESPVNRSTYMDAERGGSTIAGPVATAADGLSNGDTR
jgi:hypothetical protein